MIEQVVLFAASMAFTLLAISDIFSLIMDDRPGRGYQVKR
ncbi:hypothetical protein HMPREF1249_0847 [Jonquetella sp. BV3C21]|nr:hypothetical protein HMPREF1249_0847 [Jonquetella sp. BV3C21]